MSISTVQKKKVSYFREVQNELKKVNWTSRKELILSTRAVVFATFLFGLAIYLCDLVIRASIDGIGAIVRSLFG